MPEDLRQRVGRSRVSPLTRSTPLRGRFPFWLSSGFRHGNNSIFVGNLPMSISLSQLRDVFGDCGSIRAVEIISKASATGNDNQFQVRDILKCIAPGNSAFAFVEFAAEREAKSALSREVILAP